MSQLLVCSQCGAQVDAVTWIWRCTGCGAPLDFVQDPVLADLVSLGEPQTPLVQIELEQLTVTAKLEGALPTGSFKDRGSQVVATALRAFGIDRAVIDSSGNAGASLAAYCARAGVLNFALAAASSAAYAAHSWTPWFILGTASFAYELHAQLGRAPDAIVLPVGAGTLLLGIACGFSALARQGVVDHVPRLYGVQSTACAPLASAFELGLVNPAEISVGDTDAEGIKIARPPRGAQILAADLAAPALREAIGRKGRPCHLAAGNQLPMFPDT